METFTHLPVTVEWALEEIRKGNNISFVSAEETLIALNRSKAEGKTFYTGCTNTDKDGKCKGHQI